MYRSSNQLKKSYSISKLKSILYRNILVVSGVFIPSPTKGSLDYPAMTMPWDAAATDQKWSPKSISEMIEEYPFLYDLISDDHEYEN